MADSGDPGEENIAVTDDEAHSQRSSVASTAGGNGDDSNENSSDSDSSSDGFKFLDEWEERRFHQNRQIDRIIEDFLLNSLLKSLNMNEDFTPITRRRRRRRERDVGEERLMNDYFVDRPTFSPEIFRRKFRMRKLVFLRIVEAVTANDEYFEQTPGATGSEGLSPLRKCSVAMRVLAYGASSDAVDEYLRISEDVTREALVNFVEGVISCFSDEYLRRPNEQDLTRLLRVREQRGFPGMIGSIDCMHWELKNCPDQWADQYAKRNDKPTIILEAVASYDLWIWHAFFGTPGSCGDINVLHRSPVFSDILEGRASEVSYVVNGQEYDMSYYLTDLIYPPWTAFVKPIICPMLRKHKLFVQHQEAVRKDVERAFVVLQGRFAFLRRPCLVWDRVLMGKIMMACIIMHNMIIEDERDIDQTYYDPTNFFMDDPINNDQHFQYSTERIASLSIHMTNKEQLRNRETHCALRNDLIEHIWQKFGPDN